MNFCRGVFFSTRELLKHVDHLISEEIILVQLKSLLTNFTNPSRWPLYKVAHKSELYTFFPNEMNHGEEAGLVFQGA